MLLKLKAYLFPAVLALLVFTSGASLYLWQHSTDLNRQLKTVTTQYTNAKENLEFVSKQLTEERILRKEVETVLNELKDVPDEIYSEKLNPSLRTIISNFHGGVQ